MSITNKADNAFGMVGLGTMGANLLQNIADRGYRCAGYDNNAEKVQALNGLNRDNIRGYSDLRAFVDSLKSPRTVMLLVPAGKIVDAVIEDLIPTLDPGDIIIDGGNSHFTDTDRRFKDLEGRGYHFIGMGVSGGEEGARHGPSMMPGGDEGAYETVRPILEKIAAHVGGEPTVAYMGKGAAGHFVKMVHNGIEYALMQLISETYDVLNKGLGMNDEAIHGVFENWNQGRLRSYLLEITRDIFAYKKPGSNHLLLNDIKDEAKAKGTGKWTSQAAMDLSVAVPLIDVSVAMRDLSKYKGLRTEASKLYPDPGETQYSGDPKAYVDKLESAYYFAMTLAYAQGMHLLHKASESYGYGLHPDRIAKIWRGGCIIRSAFLEDVHKAYQTTLSLEHLLLDPGIQVQVAPCVTNVRKVVTDAAAHGISLSAFSSALSYFDSFRNSRMPANLIQAQRDYFGSHTYELKGKEGTFHTEWTSTSN